MLLPTLNRPAILVAAAGATMVVKALEEGDNVTDATNAVAIECRGMVL